jgi:LPS-assembly protein
MLDRLYLVYFLFLFASISFANEANWNCQQDKNTKEWVCVGSANPAEPSAKTVPKIQDRLKASPDLVEKGNPSKSSEDAAAGVTAPKAVKPEAAETSKKDQSFIQKPSQEEKPADSKVSEKAIEQEQAPAPVANPISTQALQSPAVSETPPPVISASKKPPPAASNKPPVDDNTKQNGWNCDTKGEEGKWNCQLVGADPKGEARIVEAEEHSKLRFLDPAFDNKQELVFNTLRDRFKTNPWGNCTIELGTQKYYIPDKSQREKSDMDVNSNYSEIYDNEIGNYQGNVEMKRADQRASSNSANYDTVSEMLDLHGNVFYSEDELSLYSDTATLKLASDEARLRDTLFISPTTPLRGKANTVYRDSKTLSRFKGVAYTSCEPGNQDWVVHATDLKMNKQTGKGAAKNAWVEFKGIPVFYSPYLSFPIDNRRKSGFLAPVYGNTSKGGFSFSAPFYWNIAPNLDATLRPRYYTSRGALLAGDFRYLTEKSNGQVSAEYMPNDSVTNKPRYLAAIKNSTHFTPNISSNLDLNLVSDKLYFSELGNALSFPTFSNIKSTADVSYVDQDISLIGRVESYQTIDPTLTGRLKPYRRLPQVNFNLKHEFESMPVNTAMESEYVYFQHDDSTLPDGHRFNVKPSVSFPVKADSAYVMPKFSLQHTDYLLNTPSTGLNDTVSRTLPIASLDSGLFFEKDLKFTGSSFLHTLEPRLFYLYIPRVNQKNIPIFDTSLYDFQYDSLFRENRFSGTDRTQDANQMTAALTSRLIDSETGLERLKFNIGEIFYFQDREVTAPVIRIGTKFLESPVQTSSYSPLVAELGSEINKHVSVDSGVQWDPHTNEMLRGKALLHFVNNPGELFNVGFTYRKSPLIRDAIDSLLLKSDAEILAEQGISRLTLESYRNNKSIVRSQDIIQSDVSFRWPVYDDWFAVGRWQYSLLFNKTQDAFLGFEKENCCWRFKIIARHYATSTTLNGTSNVSVASATSTSQTGIFFQIELKGLTGLGTKLDDFFTQTIYGYRKPEK